MHNVYLVLKFPKVGLRQNSLYNNFFTNKGIQILQCKIIYAGVFKKDVSIRMGPISCSRLPYPNSRPQNWQILQEDPHRRSYVQTKLCPDEATLGQSYARTKLHLNEVKLGRSCAQTDEVAQGRSFAQTKLRMDEFVLGRIYGCSKYEVLHGRSYENTHLCCASSSEMANSSIFLCPGASGWEIQQGVVELEASHVTACGIFFPVPTSKISVYLEGAVISPAKYPIIY